MIAFCQAYIAYILSSACIVGQIGFVWQEQCKLIILKLADALIKRREWFVETLRFPAIATYADWREEAAKESTEVEEVEKASLVVKICKNNVKIM